MHRACISLLVLLCATRAHAGYLIGAGKADITGPVADVNLMGYAHPLQIARGLHTRLYARAFVFAERNNSRQTAALQCRTQGFQLQMQLAVACTIICALAMHRRGAGLLRCRSWGTCVLLQALYGGLYSKDNVLLSGTHTHASPAGFLQYVLYDLASLGFVRQSFDALLDGITEAIIAAHEDAAPAAASYASGQLLGANINRSPTAYLANPAAERAGYDYDVDKDMELLRIKLPMPAATAAPGQAAASAAQAAATQVAGGRAAEPGAGVGSSGGEDQGRGMISWFPVHCTSMNNSNPYVSGDNKGLAAQIVEMAWSKQHSAEHATSSSSNSASGSASARSRVSNCTNSGSSLSWLSWYWGLLKCLLFRQQPAASSGAAAVTAGPKARLASSFVAAFAQSSVGDTSPNVQGAFCLDSGEPCEMHSSTCNGRNELCHGRGPAWPDDTASTAVIGKLQANKAQQLWQAAGTEVSGPIDFRHKYINMSNVKVLSSRYTRAGVTCPPAMGFSFAAGTTDGPGAFDFKQGDVTGNPFWKLVRDFISPPLPGQQACQAPKPILLNTGYIKAPYPWQPDVTELSVIRLGNFVIIGVPGEFSTMAGRRMRAAVADTIGDAWGPGLKVVLSGLSGTYSSYITTYEEYQVQRYEGASTLYGALTLDAYIQTVLELVQSMLSGRPVVSSVAPPDLLSQQISLLGPVVMDAVPAGANFGDVVVQPLLAYSPGQSVEAVFRSGCPRNNLRRGGTFLAVQILGPGGWFDVARDDDWATHFFWSRHWKLSTQSFAIVRWTIPNDAADGVYRLVTYGDAKPLPWGSTHSFQGSSSRFQVTSNPALLQQLLAEVRPPTGSTASRQSLVCGFVDVMLAPQGTVGKAQNSSDSSWPSATHLQSQQQLQQAALALQWRLGCHTPQP